MKAFRLALAALCLSSAPALSDPISLSRLSAYLNGITTAQAEFRQINADGSISTGELSIKRPGRARFDYDRPNKALVIAGGGQVAIFDDASNQGPEQYPLSKTPLSLILDKNVDLGRSGMIVGHDSYDGFTRVVAQDPAHPDYGTIALIFTDNPVALREWIITDEVGNATKVVLGDMQTGLTLPASLFSIILESNRRSGGN
ncbi:Outer membrane lipoprotein carrier protein LolA [Rhodovulum sp. P5]|uniref:LolA family protein n=1 Tax=Rhodovulum sp. P5 TaxID=1564506 RepID=UPI0009C38D1E|nr:outer membrane lipoprotein carrier protein LolA [Rhodovulum sp. P5]ARE40510.1 Outer membrane lipoprotein carrier protein LolA [Rhodovulum sp. P5]